MAMYADASWQQILSGPFLGAHAHAATVPAPPLVPLHSAAHPGYSAPATMPAPRMLPSMFGFPPVPPFPPVPWALPPYPVASLPCPLGMVPVQTVPMPTAISYQPPADCIGAAAASPWYSAPFCATAMSGPGSSDDTIAQATQQLLSIAGNELSGARMPAVYSSVEAAQSQRSAAPQIEEQVDQRVYSLES